MTIRKPFTTETTNIKCTIWGAFMVLWNCKQKVQRFATYSLKYACAESSGRRKMVGLFCSFPFLGGNFIKRLKKAFSVLHLDACTFLQLHRVPKDMQFPPIRYAGPAGLNNTLNLTKSYGCRSSATAPPSNMWNRTVVFIDCHRGSWIHSLAAGSSPDRWHLSSGSSSSTIISLTFWLSHI